MAAIFEFVTGGIGVMPDPDDNAANHVNPNQESGTRISFEVRNVGDTGGSAEIGVEVDDVFHSSVRTSSLNPGGQEAMFVRLGRLTRGRHSVLTFVNPGSGQADHESNSFDVE